MKIRIEKILKGDPYIWGVFFFLSFISLIAVYTSIGKTAIEVVHSTPMKEWIKHLVFVAASWIIAIILSNYKNYRLFAGLSRPGLLVIWALLVVVFVVGGRWFRIAGFAFQPSEFAKLILILYLAAQLSINNKNLDDLGLFLRLGIVIVITIGLVGLQNFSTAALIGVPSLLVLFIGGINKKYWWRSVGVAAIMVCCLLVYSYFKYSETSNNNVVATNTEQETFTDIKQQTWGHRVYTWMHRDTNELNQVNQAHMAIATGGVKGVGIGGTVLARLFTQADSDFIFSIILEEGGLFVGLFIILLYSILYGRCVILGAKCKGRFGTLAIGGLGTLIYIQALVHMGYNVGLIPVTGQTLPLISHGGSAYIMFGCTIGIIQCIAHDIKKNEDPTKKKRGTVEQPTTNTESQPEVQ